jgi:hypothetical protein
MIAAPSPWIAYPVAGLILTAYIAVLSGVMILAVKYDRRQP